MPDNHKSLRLLHEQADGMVDFSEVLDELAAQVEQMKSVHEVGEPTAECYRGNTEA